MTIFDALEEKVEYPIGHRRRFSDEQQRKILNVSPDGERLNAMTVNDYVDLYAV